jgi:polyhydroxybutyrate depolymerase
MKKLLFLALILFAELAVFAQPMQEQLIWQNRTRRFITFLPDAYEPGNDEQSLPLVINMHPFLTDGPFQMRYTRFNGIANREDFIVVYPYGIQGRWNSGSFFGIEQPIDDAGFLDALIDYMAVLYNIDTRRVYSTGFSAGGYMSHRLACELTNRIAAIAPVAASMNPDLVPVCDPARAVPVMILNGTADAIVPYNGFDAATSVDQVVELWRSLNGCDPEAVEEDVPDISTTDNTTSIKRYFNNCEDGAEVILYKIFGGGHTWPGRDFPLLGNTSQDVIANEVIWEFFSRHRIPDDVACAEPAGLTAAFDGSTVSLYWDAVDGIDFYSLLYVLPGGELELVENISTNTYDLQSEAEGELAWMVRAQCNSGHASWSAIDRSDISARLAGGRLAMFTWPNPATDELHIEFDRDHIPASLSIINAFGLEVRSVDIAPGQDYLRIDISGLEDGIYHVLTPDQSYSAQTLRKW